MEYSLTWLEDLAKIKDDLLLGLDILESRANKDRTVEEINYNTRLVNKIRGIIEHTNVLIPSMNYHRTNLGYWLNNLVDNRDSSEKLYYSVKGIYDELEAVCDFLNTL